MVSFPNLAYDVGLLACEDDRIVSLAPAGSDPHEYQLTPEDVELLRRADLIISTGHVPFEARIKELEVAIVQNEDELRLGRLAREGSIYYVDENGTPTRVWVGPTLKRWHELRKRQIDAMFV